MRCPTRPKAKRRIVGSSISWCVLLAAFSSPGAGADWPHWRGPNRDGISPETELLFVWRGKPRVLWEREVGSAFSGVAVAGERAFTCGTRGGMQVLFSLRVRDGAVLWTRAIERELQERQGGDGTRATPSVDGDRVYILGAGGTLLCARAEDGSVLWKKTFHNAPRWAYSGSVLVDGGLAIVSPGGDEGGLVALDKRTGREVWRAAQDGAGYSTPAPFTLEGTRYVACFLARSAVIVERDGGRLVWSLPWKTSYDVNAATPIYHEGLIFFSSGYGKGAALFALEKKRDGGLEAKEVWRSRVLRHKFQTPVLYEGHLYGADEQGLKCVEFGTGRLRWEVRRLPSGRRTRHGTVLIAGGRIIFLSEGGELVTAEASPEGFEPLAHAQVLEGRCWTAPSLADGRLYARNLEKVICLDLRRPRRR